MPMEKVVDWKKKKFFFFWGGGGKFTEVESRSWPAQRSRGRRNHLALEFHLGHCGLCLVIVIVIVIVVLSSLLLLGSLLSLCCLCCCPYCLCFVICIVNNNLLSWGCLCRCYCGLIFVVVWKSSWKILPFLPLSSAGQRPQGRSWRKEWAFALFSHPCRDNIQ